MGKLLRTIGVAIAVGAIVCGVWLQFSNIYGGDKYGRIVLALTALTPLAVGFVLIAVGHALALYEDAKRPSSD